MVVVGTEGSTMRCCVAGRRRSAGAAEQDQGRAPIVLARHGPGWFRVFRTMTRDAMAALELQRDPTLRITMPEESCEEDEANSLSPTQLAAFLTAMRTHY